MRKYRLGWPHSHQQISTWLLWVYSSQRTGDGVSLNPTMTPHKPADDRNSFFELCHFSCLEWVLLILDAVIKEMYDTYGLKSWLPALCQRWDGKHSRMAALLALSGIWWTENIHFPIEYEGSQAYGQEETGAPTSLGDQILHLHEQTVISLEMTQQGDVFGLIEKVKQQTHWRHWTNHSCKMTSVRKCQDRPRRTKGQVLVLFSVANRGIVHRRCFIESGLVSERKPQE